MFRSHAVDIGDLPEHAENLLFKKWWDHIDPPAPTNFGYNTCTIKHFPDLWSNRRSGQASRNIETILQASLLTMTNSFSTSCKNIHSQDSCVFFSGWILCRCRARGPRHLDAGNQSCVRRPRLEGRKSPYLCTRRCHV